MSEPILKAMRHTPMEGSASIEDALIDLATESARAVAEDLNQMARYGKISDAPSAVNLQGVKMLNEDWTLAVVVVAYPDVQVDGAGNFVQAAFEGTVAEHRKAREANLPALPAPGEEDPE